MGYDILEHHVGMGSISTHNVQLVMVLYVCMCRYTLLRLTTNIDGARRIHVDTWTEHKAHVTCDFLDLD